MDVNWIEGKKVTLRSPLESDITLMHQWEINDASIENKSPDYHDVASFINRQDTLIINNQQRWCIIENKSQLPIGCIDMYDYDVFHAKAAVGILIASNEHRNKGYATDALHLLQHLAFKHFALHQLYAYIGLHNEASFKLFQKSGYEAIGILKDWLRKEYEYESVYLFQLINYSI
jgi:diamine N-acetyltransferase